MALGEGNKVSDVTSGVKTAGCLDFPKSESGILGTLCQQARCDNRTVLLYPLLRKYV